MEGARQNDGTIGADSEQSSLKPEEYLEKELDNKGAKDLAKIHKNQWFGSSSQFGLLPFVRAAMMLILRYSSPILKT